MSQYLRVGVVDGHPLGVQQDGVTAAVGILLGHVVVYRLQRQVDAANVSLAPAVPNPAGHAPHLLVHAAPDRIVLHPGRLPPQFFTGRRDLQFPAAGVAAEDMPALLHEPDAAHLGVHLRQRRGQHLQFGLRGRGMRAHELRRHREHLLRTSEFGLQEPVVILADLRDDPFAHLHGHSVDDAAGDEHTRHQQDQQNRSRHQKPPFGCVPLSCHSGQM